MAKQTSEEEAKPAPLKQADGFLDRLALKLAPYASARTVYGEAVTRDGITVIPVARVMWGFGGGRRHSEAPELDTDDVGGGGGIKVQPTGYIEIKDGASEFRPIRLGPHPVSVGLLSGAAVLGLLIYRLTR